MSAPLPSPISPPTYAKIIKRQVGVDLGIVVNFSTQKRGVQKSGGTKQAARNPNEFHNTPSHNLCTNSPRFVDSPEDRGNMNLRPKSSHYMPMPQCRSFSQYWVVRCTPPSFSLPLGYWSMTCRNEYKSCTNLQNLHDGKFFHYQRSSDRE